MFNTETNSSLVWLFSWDLLEKIRISSALQNKYISLNEFWCTEFVLAVSVSDDTHCGSWLPCKFPTGILTPSRLVLHGRLLPSHLFSRDRKSSHRTPTFLLWCETCARQEETLPTPPKKLFPTSYLPWTRESLGSCELWKAPSDFPLCACVRPLITFCLQSCFSQCSISNRAMLHLVMQPKESR